MSQPANESNAIIEVRYNVAGWEHVECYAQDLTGYAADELSDAVLDFGTPERPLCDWDELVGVRRVP